MKTAKHSTTRPVARLRALTLVLAATTGLTMTSAGTAHADVAPIPSSYQVEAVPASVTIPAEVSQQGNLSSFTYVTGPDYYAAKMAELGHGTALSSRIGYNAAGDKTGVWFAVRKQYGAGDGTRGIVWNYQPFGLYCGSGVPEGWTAVALDTFTNTLGCLPNEPVLRNVHGDAWWNGLYKQDTTNCGQYGEYAYPRPDTSQVLICFGPKSGGGTGVARRVSFEQHTCAPWEVQDRDLNGRQLCEFTTYDWMPSDTYPTSSPVTEVTRSASVTVTREVSATAETGPNPPAVTVRVKVRTVRESVSKVVNGRRYTGVGVVRVYNRASAAVPASATVVRSATATRVSSCSAATGSAAQTCARERATAEAAQVATAEAQAQASSSAQTQAFLNSQSKSTAAATKSAKNAPVSKARMRSAQRAAVKAAKRDLARKIQSATR